MDALDRHWRTTCQRLGNITSAMQGLGKSISGYLQRLDLPACPKRCFLAALISAAAALLLTILLLNWTASAFVDERSPRYLACSWNVRGMPQPLFCTNAKTDPIRVVEGPAFFNKSYKPPDLVVVSCRFTDLDSISSHKAGLACTLGSFGIYSKPFAWDVMQVPTNHTLNLQIYNQYMQLSDGQAPQLIEATVLLGIPGGNANEGVAAYPYSVFTFQVDVSVWLQNSITNESHPLPVHFTFVHGYHNLYDVSIYEDPQFGWRPTVIVVNGQISLNTLSRQLFVVLQVVMWVVAFLTLLATLLWSCSSDPNNDNHGAVDLLSFSGALLFALPSMRGLWPAAPVGGTKVDVLCIYAQLICVGIAIIAQLGRRAYHEARAHP